MGTAPTRTAPAAWTEALDRSAAEIAAGQTVPLAPVLDELRARADRLEARARAGRSAPRTEAARRA